MTTYLNYCPHEIKVQLSQSEETRVYPSLGSARAAEQSRHIGISGCIEIRQISYKEIIGLPEPQEGVKYIVSMVVAQINHISENPRDDLISPDTGATAIRGQNGQISIVTGFTVM